MSLAFMKKRKKIGKGSQPRTARPKLLPINEEMQQWSVMLATELKTWPAVSMKSMFGFLSFYRSDKIFAAVPRSRGFNTPSSFILKFDPMPAALFKRAKNEPRLDTSTRISGKGWFSFELSSNADLRDGLVWLHHAYQAAKK
jgi:hypothetical protein